MCLVNIFSYSTLLQDEGVHRGCRCLVSDFDTLERSNAPIHGAANEQRIQPCVRSMAITNAGLLRRLRWITKLAAMGRGWHR